MIVNVDGFDIDSEKDMTETEQKLFEIYLANADENDTNSCVPLWVFLHNVRFRLELEAHGIHINNLIPLRREQNGSGKSI